VTVEDLTMDNLLLAIPARKLVRVWSQSATYSEVRVAQVTMKTPTQPPTGSGVDIRLETSTPLSSMTKECVNNFDPICMMLNSVVTPQPEICR
jgi:hypothetical protein